MASFDVTQNPYNATGDGSTDDTAAVQSAIDDAGLNGGDVYFPRSLTFLVNPLNASYSNVRYYGGGRLKLKAQNLSTIGDHAILKVWGSSGSPLENVIVEDLVFSGNTSAHSGTAGVDMECINFKYVSNGRIVGNRIEESISEGIDLDHSENNIVTQNHIFDCGGNGIHVSTDSARNVITSNYVQNCGGEFDRNGIDQYESAVDNLYVSNMLNGNNRNLKIIGSGAPVGYNKLISGAYQTTLEGAISDRTNDRHTDQTTNLFIEEQIVQTGFKTKAGDGTNLMDVAITFDTQFDDIKLAKASMVGTLPTASGVPATIKDATGGTSGASGITVGCQSITDSGMTVRLARSSGTFSTGTRYGFVWEAKGIKRQV